MLLGKIKLRSVFDEDLIEIYYGNKQNHLKAIATKSKIDLSDMIFFDNQINIYLWEQIFLYRTECMWHIYTLDICPFNKGDMERHLSSCNTFFSALDLTFLWPHVMTWISTKCAPPDESWCHEPGYVFREKSSKILGFARMNE